jgi:hypothetical protein
VAAQRIETLRYDEVVAYRGDGPLLRLVDPGAEGQRTLFVDPDSGRVTGQIHAALGARRCWNAMAGRPGVSWR